MKTLLRWVSLSALLALSVAAGCGDDDDDSSGASGSAGSSAAGSGGSAGSTAAGSGGSAGSSAGSGGSAGSSAGSGGSAGDAGSAGSAGSAGGSSADEVGGCTIDKAEDKTAGDADVSVSGFAYSPRCTKIKKGAKINFKGNSGTHPLMGMTATGSQPNPVGGPTMSDTTITFDAAGTFGFYCINHGQDAKSSTDSAMAGAIFVVE